MLLAPVPSNLSDSNQEGPRLSGSGELLSIPVLSSQRAGRQKDNVSDLLILEGGHVCLSQGDRDPHWDFRGPWELWFPSPMLTHTLPTSGREEGGSWQ